MAHALLKEKGSGREMKRLEISNRSLAVMALFVAAIWGAIFFQRAIIMSSEHESGRIRGCLGYHIVPRAIGTNLIFSEIAPVP